jgi:hypothetical protein
MAQSNQERVGRALELLRSGLRPFVEGEFRERYGEQWEARAIQSLRQDRERTQRGGGLHLDAQALLQLVWQNWNELFQAKLGRTEHSLVSELMEVRNRWAHQVAFSNDDAYRALDSASRLLAAVGAAEAVELDRLKRDVLREMLAGEVPSTHPGQPSQQRSGTVPALGDAAAPASVTADREHSPESATQATLLQPAAARTPAPKDRQELERRFHAEMVSVYQSARGKYGYVATRFLAMVNEKGGLRAAKELLRSATLSDGLIKLWELNALDISMEARIVYDPTWHPLFSEEEIARAKKRLDDLEYLPPGKP